MTSTIKEAKAALERIRLAANSRESPSAEDVEILVNYLVLEEKVLLGAIDLLAQSRNAFRSKQVERARKLLEELMPQQTQVAKTTIEVNDWALGDAISKAKIRMIAEQILGDRPGHWTIHIRGDQKNDLWEGTVHGPEHFVFTEPDIGGNHDAVAVRQFLMRAAAEYDGRPL